MWNFQTTRSPDDSTQKQVQQAIEALLNRQDLGFFNLDRIKTAVTEVEKVSQPLAGYQNLVVIGLGGSSLGAKTLVSSLVGPERQGQIHFLDNVDSHSLENWLNRQASPETIGWVLCSKSGGTLESLTLYDFCSQYFAKSFDIAKNTIVISEDKSSLVTEFARENGCPQLTIPLDIGGRFSVFTPVGLLPAAFFGLSGEKFLKGCEKALANRQRLTQVVSTLWQSHQRQELIFYSFQYCDRLNTFGLWLQQLWSESLGKAKKRNGEDADVVATIVPCRGASDQHSVLQQIIEGPEKKYVCFHRVASSEKGKTVLETTRFKDSLMLKRSVGELLGIQAEATEKAVFQSQAGTMVLKTEELSEETIGELLMLWMLVIGSLGELLDINAFDQPGVESGKVITRRVLSQVD